MSTICRLLALVALAAFLSACGNTSPTPTKAAAPKRSAVTLAVSTARSVCGTVSRQKFAADFGMSTTSPTVLAHRYARGYDTAMRRQVEDACLRAMR